MVEFSYLVEPQCQESIYKKGLEKAQREFVKYKFIGSKKKQHERKNITLKALKHLQEGYQIRRVEARINSCLRKVCKFGDLLNGNRMPCLSSIDA